MDFNRYRKFFPVGIFVIASVAALTFCIPLTSASPYDNDRVPGLTEARDLNVTNASLANKTIPTEYQVTPTLIKIGVEYEGTLTGAKGEMALGPRTIGFSLSPETLIIVLIATVAAMAGIGYIVWRKRNEEDKEK